MKNGTTNGVACPACESRRSLVKDSRPAPYGIRRRRVCESCAHRWTTLEVRADEADKAVYMNALAERVFKLRAHDQKLLVGLLKAMEAQ